MNFESDWFMRQLESIAEGVARKVLKKPAEQEHKELDQFSGDDLLFFRLCALVAQKDFCAAEDLLWENLRPGDHAGLTLAVDVYRKIGEYSSETLEAHGFSRQEVLEGLERAQEFILSE